ncbi:hypothetical protein ACJX0J_017406, partial [Zea mays]
TPLAPEMIEASTVVGEGWSTKQLMEEQIVEYTQGSLTTRRLTWAIQSLNLLKGLHIYF